MLARRATWLVAVTLAAFALVRGVGSAPLMDPDEGRNAEVAREMAESGDFVVPHLIGLPYLDKPVLYFATGAAAIALLGPTELAARLPSIGFTLATVALVVLFGSRRFGRETGWIAGLALATSPLVVAFARIVIFDSALMFWVTAASLAFLVGWERDGWRWFALGWAAAGCATLTKGPVGLLLPLMLALAWALLCGRRLRPLFHPAGLLAYVGVVAPWFLAVTARHPEFPHYAFVRETFERVTTDRMRRTGPITYFLPLLLLGALPWIWLPLAVPRRWLEAWRERRAGGAIDVYLLLWVLLPLVFFSLSQSKRPGYILPVFPAVALIAGRALVEGAAARRVAALCVGLSALAAVGLALGGGAVVARIDARAVAEALHAVLPAFAIGLALCAAACVVALRVRANALLAASLALLPIAVTLGASSVFHAVAEDRSARALSRALLAEAPGEFRVVGLQAFPPSLAFYLERNVLLESFDARELGSNYIAEYVSQHRGAANSPLRSLGGWLAELHRCPEPTFYVTAYHDLTRRARLQELLPMVVETRRWAAYGPCRAEAG